MPPFAHLPRHNIVIYRYIARRLSFLMLTGCSLPSNPLNALFPFLSTAFIMFIMSFHSKFYFVTCEN